MRFHLLRLLPGSPLKSFKMDCPRINILAAVYHSTNCSGWRAIFLACFVQYLNGSATRMEFIIADPTSAAAWPLARLLSTATPLQALVVSGATTAGNTPQGNPHLSGQLLYLRLLTPPDAELLRHMCLLRVLDLAESRLLRLPDGISALKCLQQLILEACSSLQQLPDSIGALTGLLQLNLWGCYSLQQMPDSIGALTGLQQLELRHCSSLQQLPDSIGTLTGLGS